MGYYKQVVEVGGDNAEDEFINLCIKESHKLESQPLEIYQSNVYLYNYQPFVSFAKSFGILMKL